MAHCTSCGRELPAFSIGPLSTVCRDCKGSENSRPVLPSVVILEERSSAISLSLILVGANLAVFVLMGLAGVSLVSETPVDLVKWGADWGPLSLSTQPWRVLTSNYVQVGIIHIGFNMWCLVNLGALAERVLDRWTYFLTYTATGIAGSLASLAWHPTVVGAGASGPIFGLAGALLIGWKALSPTRLATYRMHPGRRELLSIGIRQTYLNAQPIWGGLPPR